MALENPNCEKSEGSLFSISGTPSITSERLNGKNYLGWSASVEFWFLGQGHYDHLEKSLDEISEEKRDQWKKLDYQLCALLWQSVESDILANFRAFKTCHSFWKKAQSVFAYDTQRLYDSAQKLVTLKQSDHDMISYVSKAQSAVEELKMYLEADTLEEIKKKLDNLFVMLVLCGMRSDYEHVRDQILTGPEVPSIENLVIRLLQVPSPKTGDYSTDSAESSAMVSNHGERGGPGNCGGRGGGRDRGRPQCSYCKRMGHTQDTCCSLHGFPEKMVNISRSETPEKKFSEEEYQEYLQLKAAKESQSSFALGAHTGNTHRTVSNSSIRLEDEDIVCFQKDLAIDSEEHVRYPDVPSYLEYVHNCQEWLKKEKEYRKEEKAEAHLYIIIKVARDEDLAEQIGKDIYFDLIDHDKVRSFRVLKQMSFNLFKEEVAKEFGIPVQCQRFWLWAKRQNHTYRPNRPLTHMEEAQSIGQLRKVAKKVHNAELNLFLEVELGLDLCPIAPPERTKDDILLFFKLYDPEKEELRYVGRLFVKSTGKPSKILKRLNKMAGYDPDEEIGLYEEIKFEPNVMCEPIDKKATFLASQLGDGDIVCFQKIPMRYQRRLA